MPNQQNLPHSAIATWSGFLYQGKVALYHVLKLISANSQHYSDHTLQLDSLDDFAILRNDTIVSIHQVKAKKSQNISTYRDSISLLKERAESTGCNNAFFHIAREITDADIPSIEGEFSPAKIYKYENDRFCCGLQDIDIKIEEAIKEYFIANISGETWRQVSDYLKKTRCLLDQSIIKKVIQIHGIIHQNQQAARQAAYQQRIQFSEIVDVLNADLNRIGIDNEYYFYLILNDLHRYYQEFCFEIELDQAGSQKLSHYMDTIQNLDKNHMVKFLQYIMPHRPVKFNTLEDYKDSTIVKEEIQDAFLKILNELKKAEFHTEKNLLYWNATNGSNYFPTAINAGQSHSGRVCQRVIENSLSTDLEVMYENSNLITTDINVDSILNEARRVVEAENAQIRDSKITNWKTVALVKLESAKGIINA
jgi:hypothetical protein